MAIQLLLLLLFYHHHQQHHPHPFQSCLTIFGFFFMVIQLLLLFHHHHQRHPHLPQLCLEPPLVPLVMSPFSVAVTNIR